MTSRLNDIFLFQFPFCFSCFNFCLFFLILISLLNLVSVSLLTNNGKGMSLRDIAVCTLHSFFLFCFEDENS